MNYYLRNNETDFTKWYRHIVPSSLSKLKVFESDAFKLIMDDDEYRELLIIKQQLASVRLLLDNEHLDFLDNHLFKRDLPKWGDKQKWKIYHDIYACWQQVCFPDGKSRIIRLDPVLIGGELKRLRVIRGMYVKQVAEIIGISPKSLYAYEEGTREMKISVLYELCQVYKSSMDEVVCVSKHS